MNRGLARRNIFRTDYDRRDFLGLLDETTGDYRIEIHAFSLMDNHYHLVVHTPECGLSRAMRHLNGVYTQRANKRWKTDGPIFRGRYKSVLIDSDEYLLELIRYIHLNPVEGGICRRPADHRWTSHFAYLKRSNRPDWLVVSDVLKRFATDESSAIKAFDDFVAEGTADGFEKFYERSRTVLGSKGFKEWVYRNFLGQKEIQRGVPIRDQKLSPKVPIKQILEVVAHIFDIPMSDIRSRRAGLQNDARSMAVYLIRKLNGVSHTEIAARMNAAGAEAVAQMYRRFKKRVDREKPLRKQTDMAINSILTLVKP